MLQVCIAYAVHRGMVAIAKSTNPSRIVENLKSAQIKLSVEEMSKLREVDRNLRRFTAEWLSGETLESTWDIEADESFVIN